MFLTATFIGIIVFQLLVFHLVSFPLLAIQSERQQAQFKLDAVMAKADILIVPCNVTGVDCGSCKNETEDGGVIESPQFPDPYNSNLNCLFTINAPDKKKIQLSFTEYKVDECCDFITIFDQLANLIQPNFNESDIPSAVTSPSNRMTIKFTSNVNNITRLGSPGPVARWHAIYTFV